METWLPARSDENHPEYLTKASIVDTSGREIDGAWRKLTNLLRKPTIQGNAKTKTERTVCRARSLCLLR
jgi:hypothetical protein